jgi:hypothetical protein
MEMNAYTAEVGNITIKLMDLVTVNPIARSETKEHMFLWN